MYKIKRKGQKVPKVLKNMFDSYDAARIAIRKWLLVQMEKGRYQRTDTDLRNRTVSIGRYGFSVTSTL
jgi:hypothetical protein